MTQEEFDEKYQALAHAMQSGIAAMQNSGLLPDNIKHLRVGVNMALVDNGSLIELLVKKGILTEEEVREALIQSVEKEVKRYEQQLSNHYGATIKLI